MKKIMSALMAVGAVVILSLTAACSGEEQPGSVSEPEQSQSGTVDARALSDVYSEISSLGILPEMYMMDEAYIEGYYGISADAVADKSFAVADDAMLADTVIIVKVSETGDAGAVADGFRAINMNRLAEMESYNPTQYERASKAQIGNSENYAWYIITDDNDAVMNIIDNIAA